jgi:hypothetical protein
MNYLKNGGVCIVRQEHLIRCNVKLLLSLAWQLSALNPPNKARSGRLMVRAKIVVIIVGSWFAKRVAQSNRPPLTQDRWADPLPAERNL